MIGAVMVTYWTSRTSTEMILEIIGVKQATDVERKSGLNLSMSFVSTLSILLKKCYTALLHVHTKREYQP